MAFGTRPGAKALAKAGAGCFFNFFQRGGIFKFLNVVFLVDPLFREIARMNECRGVPGGNTGLNWTCSWTNMRFDQFWIS